MPDDVNGMAIVHVMLPVFRYALKTPELCYLYASLFERRTMAMSQAIEIKHYYSQ